MTQTIQSLKDQCADDTLSKLQYISQASLLHRHLFDYVDVT